MAAGPTVTVAIERVDSVRFGKWMRQPRFFHTFARLGGRYSTGPSAIGDSVVANPGRNDNADASPAQHLTRAQKGLTYI